MSLLDTLTGPKWQHKNPEVRLRAIAQLEDASVLLELVTSDPDAQVRSAALARVTSADTLDELIESLDGPLQLQARQQRLQQILPKAEQLGQITEDDLLLRIASLTDDDDLLCQAIARITHADTLLDAASHHPLAKVRLQAAMGISDIAALEQLAQQARGRDKGVFRHCKAVLDKHHEKQEREEKLHKDINNLLQQVEQLAGADISTGYSGQLQLLHSRWPELAVNASEQQRQDFQRHLAVCDEKLQQFKQTEQTRQQVRQQENQALEQLDELNGQLQQLEQQADASTDQEERTRLAHEVKDLESRWQQALVIAPAAAGQQQRHQQLLQGLKTRLRTLDLLQKKDADIQALLAKTAQVDAHDHLALTHLEKACRKLLGELHWPEPAIPPAQASLLQAADRLLEQRTALEAQQAKYIARAEKELHTAEAALQANHSKDADRAFARARKAMKSVAPEHRQKLEQVLKPLAAQLHDVHEWQDFAIEPKKHQLIDSMKSLVDSAEDVEILAVKIQALQDEWKQVGALPHAREQALWLKFKEAADEAWKPCKAAFSKQAALHRQNLKARMTLVKQLTAYEQQMAWPDAEDDRDGPTPDWPVVQKTLDTARAAFREIKPLDARGERTSQKAFRTVCDRIYGHIKQEYARNIARKETLVERAGQLADVDDLREAIEQAKKLQQDWKSVGMTPVSVDRKLWHSFRAACDAVFARLDEQRNQQQAATQEQVKQADDLCQQASKLFDTAEADAEFPLVKSLAEVKQQIRALDLPRDAAQQTMRKIQDMEKKARERAAQLRLAREQAAWVCLGDALKSCAANKQGGDSAPPWQSGVDLPKGIDADLLMQFWQQGPSDRPDEDCRTACIALEVCGEIESPADDKQARMEYQMQRLVGGLGQQNPDTEQALLDCINGFIELRPASEWVQRFCSSLEKIRH